MLFVTGKSAFNIVESMKMQWLTVSLARPPQFQCKIDLFGWDFHNLGAAKLGHLVFNSPQNELYWYVDSLSQ